MTRLLPSPFFSLVLLLTWLALNNSVALGHWVLGAIIGFGLPILLRPLMDQRTYIRSFNGMLRFILNLLYDVVIANFEVAIRVLRSPKRLQPAFIRFPLELTHDLPITVLASTISLTPGTVSADITEDRRFLVIHVLDLQEDEETLIAGLKKRYEAPLKEIFAC
ncbi:Na+/H+ antiporter subunit E [Pokkaliibacter sp. CJK22405]|uniref:Na+/H+ antiporter subunit E n=1 Tax=Pokkaliibacter sp. CJK22405 TaxID=3384615 RepID=UPI003984A116